MPPSAVAVAEREPEVANIIHGFMVLGALHTEAQAEVVVQLCELMGVQGARRSGRVIHLSKQGQKEYKASLIRPLIKLIKAMNELERELEAHYANGKSNSQLRSNYSS
jgi:hypothetical protein